MIDKHYDIVIVGGGTAGVAAAIGASNCGNSVLLIEKTRMLGGQATNAEVGTICGLYFNSPDDVFQFNVNDFAKGFSIGLSDLSNSVPIQNNDGLKFLPYSVNIFSKYCESLLEESNVSFLTDSELIQVNRNKDEIVSIEFIYKQERHKISPKSLIDTSGISVVSELLGEQLITPKFSQLHTQIFTVTDCVFSSEQNVNLILLMLLRKQGKLDVSVVPGSYSESSVSLKLNFNESYSKEIIKQKIEKIFEILKRNIIGFREARITSIAPSLGLRVSNRAYGAYVLTEQDVLLCHKFDDAIANGNWPIEQWDTKSGLTINKIKDNDFYQIPARCLKSKEYKNLFFAGRNISATDEAIGSARVIGTCLQTGYEAGRMASEIID